MRLAPYLLIVALSGCGSGGDGSLAGPGINTELKNTTTSPTDTGTTESGATESGDIGVNDIRQDILAAINQARSTARTCGTTYNGATTPVTWNDKIAAAALLHSDDMATNNFFSHTGSDNSSPGDRLTREDYEWNTYGENIAVGFSSTTVVQAWLASAAHCSIIMTPGFTEIGAASAQNPYDLSHYALNWTLVLGSSVR